MIEAMCSGPVSPPIKRVARFISSVSCLIDFVSHAGECTCVSCFLLFL